MAVVTVCADGCLGARFEQGGGRDLVFDGGRGGNCLLLQSKSPGFTGGGRGAAWPTEALALFLRSRFCVQSSGYVLLGRSLVDSAFRFSNCVCRRCHAYFDGPISTQFGAKKSFGDGSVHCQWCRLGRGLSLCLPWHRYTLTTHQLGRWFGDAGLHHFAFDQVEFYVETQSVGDGCGHRCVGCCGFVDGIKRFLLGAAVGRIGECLALRTESSSHF